MKTKKDHLAVLRNIQSSIGIQIIKVNKEAHIPIWFLRMWGADIKSAANFMQKEMKKGGLKNDSCKNRIVAVR